MPITDRRLARFKEVVSKRQMDLTVILENVHDPHNIAAVLRTCDSVGIREIFVILNDPQIDPKKYKFGRRSSSSANKWIDVRMYTDASTAMKEIKVTYAKVYGTHLGEDSRSLYDLELSDSVALAFGNEHDGLSDDIKKHLDGNFIIPQFGMVQSLNISVACAVSVYEACRQRIAAGKYENAEVKTDAQVELLDKYLAFHEEKYLRGRVE